MFIILMHDFAPRLCTYIDDAHLDTTTRTGLPTHTRAYKTRTDWFLQLEAPTRRDSCYWNRSPRCSFTFSDQFSPSIIRNLSAECTQICTTWWLTQSKQEQLDRRKFKWKLKPCVKWFLHVVCIFKSLFYFF